MLDHKTNFNKFKRAEFTQGTFSDNDRKKLEFWEIHKYVDS